MGVLTVEQRLAKLEAKVFGNRTNIDDAISKVEYIAACDYPEIFEDDTSDEVVEDGIDL